MQLVAAALVVLDVLVVAQIVRVDVQDAVVIVHPDVQLLAGIIVLQTVMVLVQEDALDVAVNAKVLVKDHV